MATQRHLAKAPVTEALIDVRIDPQVPIDPPVLMTLAQGIAGGYPQVSEQRRFQGTVEFDKGEPSAHSKVDVGLRGIFATSEDGKQVAQFRVDGFTLNRMSPYSSFDVLLPEALRLWSHYASAVGELKVLRVAVRYINHIPLGKVDVAHLEDILLTGPRLPEGLAHVMNGFATRVHLHDPQQQASAIVTQVLEAGVTSDERTLLLDIDAYDGDPPGPTRADLEAGLLRLRGFKNRIFFGSLTDRLVERFI